ncbi:rhodopsin-like [Oscarella lobularis]|uniref:rhodopsin-like n=1 Tax=Oscarella lobularis TaxID=121494 RepID=UPI0033134055
MSGSGENISYLNQSNATDGLKNLILGKLYIQLTYFIPACIQLPLCIIALAAIARVRLLRVGQNIYIINVIFSDVLSAIVGLWVFIVTRYDYNYGEQGMIPACKAVLFLWHWQFCWSLWGTVLISRSRYLTISNPLAPSVTTRKAAITSAITCLIGFFIAALPLFTWAKYVFIYKILGSGYFTTFCMHDRSNFTDYLSLLLVYFGISYWLPLAIVIFYLVKTLRLVIQAVAERRRLTGMASNDTGKSPATPIYKSKALWFVIAIISSNAILPAAYVIVLFTRAFRQVGSEAFLTSYVMLTLNFLVNSVLYCFWVRTLTSSIRDVMCCRKLQHNVSVRKS